MNTIKTLTMLLVGVALMMPAFVSAEEFKGKIVGHRCAQLSKMCPLVGLEEHIVMEQDFVMVKEDGSIHTLHNLNRDTKVRYVGKNVVIQGDYDENTKAVYVNEFSNEEGKQIWSWKQQSKENPLGLTAG
ncbi:MAG: hypothetical protein GKR92_04845 [Gammaproteobacteria bacterium]|nr:MAG: hypothetical protein GKR92_04845 [Gammaproteobacteria bacterium]